MYKRQILCSCATGIGTAEKLKTILEDSLPKNLPVRVLTYDYSTLLENRMEDDFFDRYEVVCICLLYTSQFKKRVSF